MKRLLFTLSVLSCFTTAQAQNCGTYFTFQKGTKFELTSFDKKDKPAAIIKYEVVDSKLISGGTSFVMNVETTSPKGKLLGKAESVAKCVNGTYYTDVRNVSTEMMPQSTDMQVSVTGDQLAYPAKLSMGDKLKDASMSMKTSMNGMQLMSMETNITNRQVAGNESVTTPAGTFDCVKITYTLNMRLMGNRTLTATEWIAPGAGVVKSEQYDGGGKKIGSTLLTKRE